MGDIADWYIDQQINGRPSYSKTRTKPGSKNPGDYNKFLSKPEYDKLIRFLTHNLKMPRDIAKRLIYDRLVKRGELPVLNERKLNEQELLSLVNMIHKAGLQLEGYPDGSIKAEIKKEKEQIKMNTAKRYEVELDLSTKFRVKDGEEGERVLFVERGMNREEIAVSFSFPQYRREGFIASKKSSIFAKENDIEKVVVDMASVFESLATALNNLLSANLLTEDTYNGLLDGFQPFIYEALDYSEVEPYVQTSTGLKAGKKKRIARKIPTRLAGRKADEE